MKTFGVTDYTNLVPLKCCGRTDIQADVGPILNIGPVYKGPLKRGQVSIIMGQFSCEVAR